MLIWKSLEDAKRELDRALCGQLCVQAWLGVANTLFIGFGDEVISLPAGAKHPIPKYELQTGYTDWWVEDKSGLVGTSTAVKNRAEETASLLVGHRVEMWQFIDGTPALEICFDGDLRLKMAPYTDRAVIDEDAWLLRLPGEYYGFMRWDGSMDIGRRDERST